MPKKEDPVLAEIVETSQNSVGLINSLYGATLGKDEILKHFVMWIKLSKDDTKKEVEVHHRAHSNWKMDDPETANALARILLLQLSRKVGLRVCREILTKLELGGGLDDSQDNIN